MRQGPFFIVGPPRSGTTLLAALFNRHPLVAVPPETHYFTRVYDHPFLGRRRSGLSTKEIIDLLYENVRFQDLQLPRVQVERALSGDRNPWRNVFIAMLQAYSNRHSKPTVGEKTPQHLFFLEVILNWFPDAKIICMVRDPRDTVESLVRAPWTHSNPVRHAAHWRMAVQRVLRAAREHPRNVRVVRFEDLVVDPHSVLTELCGFVGVDPSAAMLAGGGGGVVPAWEQQWKSDAEARIDPGKLFLWKAAPGSMANQRITNQCADAMRTIGYDAERAPHTTWLSKLRLVIERLLYSPPVYAMQYQALRLRRKYLLQNKGYADRVRRAGKP